MRTFPSGQVTTEMSSTTKPIEIKSQLRVTKFQENETMR